MTKRMAPILLTNSSELTIPAPPFPLNIAQAWVRIPTMQCELFALALTRGRKGRWRQNDVDRMFCKSLLLLLNYFNWVLGELPLENDDVHYQAYCVIWGLWWGTSMLSAPSRWIQVLARLRLERVFQRRDHGANKKVSHISWYCLSLSGPLRF